MLVLEWPRCARPTRGVPRRRHRRLRASMRFEREGKRPDGTPVKVGVLARLRSTTSWRRDIRLLHLPAALSGEFLEPGVPGACQQRRRHRRRRAGRRASRTEHQVFLSAFAGAPSCWTHVGRLRHRRRRAAKSSMMTPAAFRRPFRRRRARCIDVAHGSPRCALPSADRERRCKDCSGQRRPWRLERRESRARCRPRRLRWARRWYSKH